MQVRLWQKVRFRPHAFSHEQPARVRDKVIPREVTGAVVWIHPQRRFYLVAAELPCRDILRECFMMEGR